MKRFIRCVCVILVMATVLAVPVSAVESAEARSSSYFMTYSAYLWETSDTEFEVWFDITAVGTMDELGVKTIKVQRSQDKVNWTTVKTYSMSDYEEMVQENSFRYANCVTYSSRSSKYYYSALVTFYAKKGSGTGTYTVATDII